MSLNFKTAEADRFARELADLTGESLTEALTIALRERLDVRVGERDRAVCGEIARIQERIASLPPLDRRSDEEIIGYDERALPVRHCDIPACEKDARGDPLLESDQPGTAAACSAASV